MPESEAGKVLVTGARGFIGATLSDELRTIWGYQVVEAVREQPTEAGQVVVGDINAATDWGEALRGCSAVIHLAARVHVMHEEAEDPLSEFRSTNTAGTLNLARQAAQAGVGRFVFISSIKVNGEFTRSGVPFTAEDKPAPVDSYAVSKYEAETGLLALASETGMQVVIIRPPLVYGPGVKANFLSMMRWLEKGIPLPLGAVRNTRSLVGLDNLIDLIRICLVHPAAVNQVFLVSDDEDVSTPELLRRVAAAMGRRARLFSLPIGGLELVAGLLGKKGAAKRLFGNLQVDIAKTRNLLGWRPPLALDEELRRTARAFLDEKAI